MTKKYYICNINEQKILMGLHNIIQNNIITPIKEVGTSLDQTREIIIRVSFYLAFICCLAFFLFRLIEQQHETLPLIITSGIMSAIFIWLSHKGYSQPLIIIANILYLGVAFYEGVAFNMPMQTVLYFSLYPAITVFLIKNRKIRIGFLTMDFFLFMYLNYLTQTESVSNLISFTAILLICYIILLLFIDLMERQQKLLNIAVEEQQETLQKLEAQHQDLLLFNNMINHDLKAPLRSIKGFSQLLARTKPTERQKEYLEFITNSTNNLETLISDLLLYSKMNTTELDFQEINLEEVIDEIMVSFKYDMEKNNIHCIKEGLPEIIYGNYEGLRTVFQNLISNAIKYQPKDIENHIPEIKIKYQETEAFDIIHIQDNGIGIPKEYIPKLFTPFIRYHSASEYEGTGLGLSICKKIMEKHQGNITLDKVEKGTSFCLKFPKKKAQTS